MGYAFPCSILFFVSSLIASIAAAAIETSSNQPVLPHAIIVLNASEDLIDEKLWDVVANTENILQDLANTVNRNETFKKLAQFWRERNKPIHNLTDLILCYYSSLQVCAPDQEPFGTRANSVLGATYTTRAQAQDHARTD